ncbi:Imm8 family immunity protein [Streptosporangium sp. CA-115845]|uniref:Imm8 family immunity protein n=1 Tax=Streptosporangium sp. CA-115845 TaxID=3240071 RepID=UPI003D9130DA
MRARVGAFRWPDLELGHSLDDPTHACELLEMYVGPQGEPDEERFQLTVCTPSALADQLQHHPFLIGRHWLFVPELRPASLSPEVCKGPSW